jgi:hypothetical protein
MLVALGAVERAVEPKEQFEEELVGRIAEGEPLLGRRRATGCRHAPSAA